MKKDDFISEECFQLLKGNFYEILLTQNGSRIVQNCLSKTSVEVISKLFEEIKTKIHLLINDKYGNYFIRKFFCSLLENERITFLENVI